MTSGMIYDVGLSIVYEPGGREALVDIVFVHGLQGHPWKTWACKAKRREASLPSYVTLEKRKWQARFKRSTSFRKGAGQSSKDSLQPKSVTSETSKGDPASPVDYVFWPRDLLPGECPEARIMTWGYDSKVTKYVASSTNKNSLYSYGKDLLFALRRDRPFKRPLILIAHSLGGIVVKEMLANADASVVAEAQDIAKSTAAVVFMGTPHRGSQDLSGIGEVVRKIASFSLMDTNPAALDTLGLKNTDLERNQEAFSRLWQQYNFRVKTFQEGFALTGVNIGHLNEKVVPNYSSIIGDARECAETLEANHMEMCRFSGIDDPKYRKVAMEIRGIYDSAINLASPITPITSAGQPRTEFECLEAQDKHIFNNISYQGLKDSEFDLKAQNCLCGLRYSGMEAREHLINSPAQNHVWVLKHPTYIEWLNRKDVENSHGLIWIKGKPGSGKSTIMKEAFRRVSATKAATTRVAAFFFSSESSAFERSPLALFQSLLFQLLQKCPNQLASLTKLHDDRNVETDNQISWYEEELRSFFRSMVTAPGPQEWVIFIDAIDECQQDAMRNLIYYLRQLTTSAYKSGAKLNVCVSSRHFPSVSVSRCPEIVVEDFNKPDIAEYVKLQLSQALVNASELEGLTQLEHAIVEKSSGIFLWVVLVLGMFLKLLDEGRGVRFLTTKLDLVPEALESLFIQLLLIGDEIERRTVLRFFQWVILGTTTLRLREWHHILAFIRPRTPPRSLKEWQNSEDYIENDEQLVRQIRNLSRGLVEVKQSVELSTRGPFYDAASVGAGAGSLDGEIGESRVVEVIHESVRDFFLRRNGFAALMESIPASLCVGIGHISIMETCLNYLDISELDELVQARISAARPPSPRAEMAARVYPFGHRRTASVTSFGSAASCSQPRGLVQAFKAPTPTLEPRGLTHALLRGFEGDGNGASSANSPDAYVEEAISRLVADSVEYEILSENRPPSQPSTTGKSRALDSYPALLSYATIMFFTHADLAERLGADPSTIVRQLQHGTLWRRFITLHEGFLPTANLMEFCVDENLGSWVRQLLKEERDPSALFCIAAERSKDRVLRAIMRHEVDSACTKAQPNRRTSGLLFDIIQADRATELENLLPLYWKYLDQLISDGEITTQDVNCLVNAQSLAGQTALHIVVGKSRQDTVTELLRRGAKANTPNWNGRTPLHIACFTYWPSHQNIKALLQDYQGINVKDSAGRTPLHYACRFSDNVAVVAELLRHGADVDMPDDYGQTPLVLARQVADCSPRPPAVAEELLRWGAKSPPQVCDNPRENAGSSNTISHGQTEGYEKRNIDNEHSEPALQDYPA
ncbi:hypothetical protein SAMD00023353_3900570 [Rosellinia necatrix]|uniref:Nephrocystin 3-like N-terminal domain-containing protein n=1 Tax=Rosellinia necatrix TaxID=77044 RepID=A0A1S7UNL0_ROSNE|nr:hypothetical protein SAMD00023353_3900570 [Rosellinia necatrix]